MAANGRLPNSALASIGGGYRLRHDAARAFNAMNVEARRRYGRSIGVISAYRTYQRQVELFRQYGAGRAARPGTSNHGTGIAVDLTPQWSRWAVDQIGARYGFSKRCSDAPCVPLDTRILTRRGFQTCDELRSGDETVGYNLATGSTEWTPVLAWGIYDDAELVRYSSQRMELVCTPNHRWIRRRRSGRVEMATLDQTAQLDSIVTAARGAQGPGLDLTVHECALLGWAMTDGSIYRFETKLGRRAFARLYQRKAVGVAAVEALMEHFDHRYDPTYRTSSGDYTHMWYVGRPAFSPILHRSGLDDIGPVRMVLAMTTDQREAWLSSVRMAEGAQPKMREIAQAAIASNAAMREAIAVAAFLSGHQPVLRPRTVDLCSPTPLRKPLISESLGRATVWCPQTPLGTWTAECGQSTLLSGNSEWWHVIYNPRCTGATWRPGQSTKPQPKRDRVLRQGMRGRDVGEVQTYLLRGGFLPKGDKRRGIPPAIDRHFGDRTADAVRRFQRREKLTADGVVGPQTWKRLRNRYRRKPKKK